VLLISEYLRAQKEVFKERDQRIMLGAVHWGADVGAERMEVRPTGLSHPTAKVMITGFNAINIVGGHKYRRRTARLLSGFL